MKKCPTLQWKLATRTIVFYNLIFNVCKHTLLCRSCIILGVQFQKNQQYQPRARGTNVSKFLFLKNHRDFMLLKICKYLPLHQWTLPKKKNSKLKFLNVFDLDKVKIWIFLSFSSFLAFKQTMKHILLQVQPLIKNVK